MTFVVILTSNASIKTVFMQEVTVIKNATFLEIEGYAVTEIWSVNSYIPSFAPFAAVGNKDIDARPSVTVREMKERFCVSV